MFTGKDFWDYFAEETISMDPVSTQKPEEPIGDLKVVWSRPLPSKPSSVTVIKDTADRYFLSFVVEIQPETLPNNEQAVGINLGIATFATLDTGEKINAPKPLKKRLKRLKKAQKNLSRKQKESKRREKAIKQVAKIHAKIKDTRTDFLQKLSTINYQGASHLRNK